MKVAVVTGGTRGIRLGRAGWPVLFLALCGTGCTTHFKVLDVKVVAAKDPTVELVVDVDMDLGAERWKEHTARLNFVVLDPERLGRIRREHPDLPEDVEAAGEFMIRDYHWHYRVCSPWKEPFDPSQVAEFEHGGFSPGKKVADGLWRHRIWIPFREFQYSSPPPKADSPDCVRSDAYCLEPGGEYLLWGEIFGTQYIGYPQFRSDHFKIKLKIPRNP